MLPQILLVLLFFLGAIIVKKEFFSEVTIFEYQRGLRYLNGKFVKLVGPGRYLLFNKRENIVTIDMRAIELVVSNQEILCNDNLAVRVSSVVSYKVEDPVLAVHSTQSYVSTLYTHMQLIMRELVSAQKVEDLLAKRNELSAEFLTRMKADAPKWGLSVDVGGIKDITFPADVKKIFNQVIQAEKAAQAALAKSRAETASLRALGNAARMMEDNPNLLPLRTLQALSELSAASGNTIVFGLPPYAVPPTNGKAGPKSAPEAEPISG